MQCPLDGTTLVMTERSGIEIDYCPKCRGVWLDRGELDKLIERAAPAVALTEPPAQAVASAAPAAGREDARRRHDENSRHWRDDDDDDHKCRPKRRGGFLDDLFDF